MSAATQGTKTMLEAIECEKQRDRYKAALERLTAATARVMEGSRRTHPGQPCMSYEHRSLATHNEALLAMGQARDALGPDQDREPNSKRVPTIARDLDREDVEPGLAPPSVAGENR